MMRAVVVTVLIACVGVASANNGKFFKLNLLPNIKGPTISGAISSMKFTVDDIIGGIEKLKMGDRTQVSNALGGLEDQINEISLRSFDLSRADLVIAGKKISLLLENVKLVIEAKFLVPITFLNMEFKVRGAYVAKALFESASFDVESDEKQQNFTLSSCNFGKTTISVETDIRGKLSFFKNTVDQLIRGKVKQFEDNVKGTLCPLVNNLVKVYLGEFLTEKPNFLEAEMGRK